MNEDNKALAEVREWLTRIDTKQEHIIQLLEDSRAKADEAYTKADEADDKSEFALKDIKDIKDELNKKYVQDDKNRKFWIKTGTTLISIFITIVFFLMPILVSYYSP